MNPGVLVTGAGGRGGRVVVVDTRRRGRGS